MKSRAILIDEFSRIGGGQVVAYNIVKALLQEYDFDLITDRNHSKVDKSLFSHVYETSYEYYDNMPMLKLLNGVRKTRRELDRIEKNIPNSLSINNHPNMFLYKADLNIVHVFFLANAIKHGKFKRTPLARLIRLSGIYKIYNNANFILAGRYMESIGRQEYRYLGISPRVEVIKFPVSYPGSIDFQSKENIVLTFGRINPDKNLKAITDIARNSKMKFIIAGAVNKGSENYLSLLNSSKPENVSIVENPSEDLKRELFSRAIVYMHTRSDENYGLTVAEAIGYGCIPVVPKSGGPWIDIVEEGKYGYGYTTIDEASEIINMLNEQRPNNLKEIYESRERFSFDTFKQRMIEYVSDVESRKK